ncbi:DUF6538 domain-containing protein [Aeromonas veronii]|uniref:DUF6538 domain-containing protein n=1 Tax=Aeromonas veronii TaxID=654 RepID=UPI003899C4CF
MKRRETWALQQKANVWYLVWNVPKAIRGLPMFGGRRLYTKTLQTGDLKEAQRKRDLVIPPFLGAFKSRGHAACARRCFGV